MPLSEPYSALFIAIKTALSAASGPFTAASAVEYWIDDEADWLQPSERLRSAMARTLPHCLICWPGEGADPRIGGGESHRENVDVVIRYACGAPQGGEDYEQALFADGSTTPYFGEFVTRKWVLDALFGLATVGAFELPPELIGTRSVTLERPGAIGRALAFRFGLLHE